MLLDPWAWPLLNWVEWAGTAMGFEVMYRAGTTQRMCADVQLGRTYT